MGLKGEEGNGVIWGHLGSPGVSGDDPTTPVYRYRELPGHVIGVCVWGRVPCHTCVLSLSPVHV